MRERETSPSEFQMFEFSFPADNSDKIHSILDFVHAQCPTHTSMQIEIPDYTLEENTMTVIGIGSSNSISNIQSWLKSTNLDINGRILDFPDTPNA